MSLPVSECAHCSSQIGLQRSTTSASRMHPAMIRVVGNSETRWARCLRGGGNAPTACLQRASELSPQAFSCDCRELFKRARTCPYPRRHLYPVGVFCHPGILHRNSCTKSRAIASALVVRLKRRDLSCIGGDLGPESLGDGSQRRLRPEPRRSRPTGVRARRPTSTLPLSDTTSGVLR